jgi:transcriptional regulator with XRE-family HTH domain
MSQDQGAESSAAFRAYAQHFGLSVRDVAFAANVRLLTVWKIEQGLPIREADALAVCAALYHLTGVPYTTLIPIIPAEILLMTQVSQAGNKS